MSKEIDINELVSDVELIVEPIEESVEEVMPIEEEIEEIEPEVEPEPEIEIVEAIQMKLGRVVDCPKLNIRTDADTNAQIACVINRGAEVEVDESESTKYFYKVYLENGFEGFAMKQFIEVE